MTDDGQFHGLMELARPAEQRRYEEAPVGSAPPVPDPKQPQGFHKRPEVGPREPQPRARGRLCARKVRIRW